MTDITPESNLPHLVRVVREMTDTDLARFEIICDLDDLVGADYEEFLDMLSERATGSILLMDISYGAISVRNDGSLIVWVEGDTSETEID